MPATFKQQCVQLGDAGKPCTAGELHLAPTTPDWTLVSAHWWLLCDQFPEENLQMQASIHDCCPSQSQDGMGIGRVQRMHSPQMKKYRPADCRGELQD